MYFGTTDPVTSIVALCGCRSDVADPLLLVHHLHRDLTVAPSVTSPKRHSYGKRGGGTFGAARLFTPEHTAYQFL